MPQDRRGSIEARHSSFLRGGGRVEGARGQEEEKMLKRLMLATILAHVCASTGIAADPSITVSARQRYPWNGLVDLHFTVTGESGTKYDTSFTAKDMVGNTTPTSR